MARLFYPHYIGDYDRDTAHLTMIQHGAYRLLLDRYYADGEPLPGDVKDLQRLIRATTREERAAINFVLGEFFELREGTYHHKRCDAELERMGKIAGGRSEAGREGAAKRWGKKKKGGDDGGGGGSGSGSDDGKRHGKAMASAMPKDSNCHGPPMANAIDLPCVLPLRLPMATTVTVTEVGGSLTSGASTATGGQTPPPISEFYDPAREKPFENASVSGVSTPQEARQEEQPVLLALLQNRRSLG